MGFETYFYARRSIAFSVGGMQLWANNPPEDISRETPLNLFITGEDTSDVQEPPLIDDGYYSDSAYAVDDEVWRQLHQAQDYFAQGVAATRKPPGTKHSIILKTLSRFWRSWTSTLWKDRRKQNDIIRFSAVLWPTID